MRTPLWLCCGDRVHPSIYSVHMDRVWRDVGWFDEGQLIIRGLGIGVGPTLFKAGYAGGKALPGWIAEAAPRSAAALENIGQLNAEHQATLKAVWRGEQSVNAPPENVRQQLAGLYSRVASQNPEGYAQSGFNNARAQYLLGQGANPGASVTGFATENGIPVYKKP